MKKINKKDLIVSVSEKAYLSLKDAKNAVDAVFGCMQNALLEGTEVNVSNFGAFKAKTRKQRIGTNPHSHEKIILKEKQTIVFQPAKVIKKKMN